MKDPPPDPPAFLITPTLQVSDTGLPISPGTRVISAAGGEEEQSGHTQACFLEPSALPPNPSVGTAQSRLQVPSHHLPPAPGMGTELKGLGPDP